MFSDIRMTLSGWLGQVAIPVFFLGGHSHYGTMTISNGLQKRGVKPLMKQNTNIPMSAFAKVVSMGAITSLICLSTASAKGSRENHNFGERGERQMQHAEQGLRSGALTQGEATRIKSHLQDMHSQLQTARATNNGHLTGAQRDRMETAQNRAARKIFELKHNQNQTIPRQLTTRTANQRQEVQQGIQSGTLSQGEVSRIKSDEEKIKANVQEAKSDGQLTKREIKRISRAQNQAGRKIQELEQNQSAPSTPIVPSTPAQD